ncbi:MAG: esterase/lipase family protein [Gemmatimonadota bacterium]
MRPRRKRDLAAAALIALGMAASAPSAHVAAAQAAPAPVPVLLVPGWFDSGRDMAALRLFLVSSGWTPESVVALSFEHPTGSNRAHAEEIRRAVEALQEKTGSDVVDMVAHSMGGLAVRWYLAHGGSARRVVFLATPQRGTWAAYLAWGAGGDEMEPSSPFLDSLNAYPSVPPGVEALTVRTPMDTHILPGESATLPGVPDVIVCCPSHAGMLRDTRIFRVVRRFLLEGEVSRGG